MAIKLITQPRGSVICGHCSIAMITGHDVETVINVMGTQNGRGSNYGMYIKYLQEHGFKTQHTYWPDNRKRVDLNGKGTISITTQRAPWNWGHAMAYENGKIYDPVGNEFESIAEMKAWYKRRKGKNIRVFSIVKIEEEAK